MTVEEMAARFYAACRAAFRDRPDVRLYSRDGAFVGAALEVYAEVPDGPIAVAYLARAEVDEQGPERIDSRAASLLRWVDDLERGATYPHPAHYWPGEVGTLSERADRLRQGEDLIAGRRVLRPLTDGA